MADEQLPPDIEFGFVAGKYVLSVIDNASDPDRDPNARPVLGRVNFEPVVTRRVSSSGVPTTIIATTISAWLDETGQIVDSDPGTSNPSSPKGVWLPTGQYKVTFAFTNGAHPPIMPVTVTAEHTDENPLWLPFQESIPTEPELKQVVNEQIYIDSMAARDAAVSAAAEAEFWRDQTEQAIHVVGAWSGTVDLTAEDFAQGPAMIVPTSVTGSVTILLPTAPVAYERAYTLSFYLMSNGDYTVTIPGAVTPFGVPPVLSADGPTLLHCLRIAEAVWAVFVGGQKMQVPPGWAP